MIEEKDACITLQGENQFTPPASVKKSDVQITLDEVEKLCLLRAREILEKDTAPTLAEAETVKSLVSVVLAGEIVQRDLIPRNQSASSALKSLFGE